MSNSYHHGDLKSVLLDYAREQMERASLDDLSMREMAKAVGVSHTAAYRHFADRRSLLDAVAVQGFEELIAGFQAGMQAAPEGPRSGLRACGLAYVAFGMATPRLLAHMFKTVAEPQASEALVGAGARLFEVLLGLVTEGQARGVFRGGDPRHLSHACWAMVHGLATLLGIGMLKTPDARPEALLQSAGQSIEVFLDGMASDRARG
ncbi:AcrR family transcriptional regulator [Variovorax sp. TBS-050B]|uniref:TetR/AcrR family transcriptional regulator n=1 Tax=Variovorax sp. TBS-050B TaxID=2940551 RepID=UPI002475AF6D|nr:TetR/AcrR family transcriptional regulator [Variovorax sp. TBS-050B]MDH6590405.1 AcrR family transcriptional regulator [Variovorax sp. TBS-050B]